MSYIDIVKLEELNNKLSASIVDNLRLKEALALKENELEELKMACDIVMIHSYKPIPPFIKLKQLVNR